jgi:hypothetical protein
VIQIDVAPAIVPNVPVAVADDLAQLQPDNLEVYRVYKKKRNLGISQEIDIVLKTKDFRRLGI